MTASLPHSQPIAEPVRQNAPVCDYLIRRGGGFYRPGAKGYTRAISEAGRWPRSEALAYQQGVEGVTIHHISEFPPDETMVLKARVEELENECRILREVMNAPSEPDVIRLHREKCDALDRVFALEEIARQSRDAMLRTRTASIAGCEEGYGKPEKWGDELFQSHAGLTNAIKAIDAALPQSSGVARTEQERGA